jgi:hypothetical protein
LRMFRPIAGALLFKKEKRTPNTNSRTSFVQS